MSGSFFGKGWHLQKETSGGVEGFAVTTVQLVATLCSAAVVGPQMWARLFRIQRAVSGSLASFSNPRGLRQNRACRSTSPLLHGRVCDRQLSFSLNSFQRSLLSLSEIKGKVKGQVILHGLSW